MTKATHGYFFSTHALDRLYERHARIFENPEQVGKQRWDSAYKVLDDSIEDNSVKNNTAFMVFLHEKYGYHKEFKFFMNGNVLFLGIIDNGKKLIVTTMDKATHNISHLRNAAVISKRFRNKPQ
jgi:hypothetical protein